MIFRGWHEPHREEWFRAEKRRAVTNVAGVTGEAGADYRVGHGKPDDWIPTNGGTRLDADREIGIFESVRSTRQREFEERVLREGLWGLQEL